jgi:CDP-glycerol glycerophosphotransferase (TagB/SpsB family)
MIIIIAKRLIIRLISLFIPRDDDLWVFGSHGLFCDNPKYLYLELNSEQNRYKKKIRSVWVCKSKEEYEQLAKFGGMNLEYYLKDDIKCIFLCLRAGRYIYSSYLDNINYSTSFGAILVNLWHGIPLKKIEFDITKEPLVSVFKNASFRNRKLEYAHIHSAASKQYVLCPRNDYATIYMSAFRTTDKKIIRSAQPRELYIKRKYQDALNNRSGNKVRTIAYLPTWRDDGKDFITYSSLDFGVLNDFLVINDINLIVKLHVNTVLKLNVDSYSNIKVVDNLLSVEDIIVKSDVLITDYSSVMYDFDVLNKPVILYAEDIVDYERSRELYFPLTNLKGRALAFNMNELIKELKLLLPTWGVVGTKQVHIDSGCEELINIIIDLK